MSVLDIAPDRRGCLAGETVRLVSRAKRGGGFTLLELLISIAIAAILLSGVVSLFVSTRDSYRLQAGINSLHDQAQYAMNLIRYELSMAGHWGGALPGDVEMVSGTNIPQSYQDTSCSSLSRGFADYEVFERSEYISLNGLDGLAPTDAGPTGLFCLGNARLIQDTDLFAVRYFGADALTLGDMQEIDDNIKATYGSEADGGAYGRAAVGGSAVIFWGLGNFNPTVLSNPDLCTPGGEDGRCQEADPEGANNYNYHEAYYYIRPCSGPPSPGGNGLPVSCAVQDIPTLTRLVLNGPAYVEQSLAEGVERMQLFYGRDTDDNNIVDTFAAFPISGAASPGFLPSLAQVGDWENVQQVQVELLVRSRERSLALLGGGTGSETYLFTDNVRVQFEGDALRYQRRLFSVTVRPRNHNLALDN